MADGKKLSSLDASFLYLETPEMPMHVGSMAIFRLPDDYKGDFFEDFKAMIVSRLHIAPILKARLEKAPLDIDHPTWVEDDQFDIDRHIFRGSLPAPRDRATLERIVGWMHAKLLNRARPLWEFYVFEGMKDNEVGLYSKMHHAAIDGGAGAALTNMIYDISPIPRKVEPPVGGAKPGQQPRDIAANLLDSYQQLFTQPLDASAAAKNLQLPRTGKSDIGSILFDNAMYQIESAVRFAGNIPTMVKSISDVLGKISDPKSRESLASMVSPPTMLNKSISSERSFAGVSISLSRSKALAKQAGGKLNDVVLALASGVVRRYLQQYSTLPAKSLTAAVPISLREEGNTEANNQVFGMICSIATNIDDPKARLEAIIAQSTKSKEMSHPLRALMPQVSNISMLGAPIIVQIMALLYSRSDLSDVLPPAANITVSNVPGPRQTLYAAGAELLHIFPVSISTHGQALNITVQSYRDQLDFGFIVGANIIPHVQVMCDMLPGEFAALEAAYAPPAADIKGAANKKFVRKFAMIEMPPLKFAQTNGIRMGYYEAGPVTDKPPVVLCHGWPELAFSWRHQIKALSEAGIRVIAPDQRGYGATDRPEPVEAYDMEHLTGDLVGLLDHLNIDKAIFVGHDWGGFVVWQMPLRHSARVAGVVGVNTPHWDRAPMDPIVLFRKRFGDEMYIVQFQDPAREPDRIFGSRVEQTFDAFMRKPLARPAAQPEEPPIAGVGASSKTNLAFPQMIAAYDAKVDPRTPILSADEKKVFVDTFTKTGFTGGINWYRNFTRNWERSQGLDHHISVPSLMIMAENDAVLPPSAADGMEKLVADLEKYLVKDSGHWTQQEKPEEVSSKLIEWLRRRFG